MRELYDGKQGEEIKDIAEIRDEALEELQRDMNEGVSEEELDEALRKARENEENNPVE